MLRRSQLTEDALSRKRETAQSRPVERVEATKEALLFATAPTAEGGPAAGLDVLGTSVVRRLLDQLESLDVRRAWVVTRLAWASALENAVAGTSVDVKVVPSEGVAADVRLAGDIAERGRGPLIVGNAHIFVHREALAGLLADPRIVSGVLATGSAANAQWSFAIRSERTRVVSAASPYHRVKGPSGYFLGVMKLDGRDRPRLAATSRELAELAAERPQPWNAELDRKAGEWRVRRWRAAVERETGTPPAPADAPDPGSLRFDPKTEADLALHRRVAADDAVSLLLVGLVRADVELSSTNLRAFLYAAPFSREAAELAGEKLAGSDEDRVLLDSAVKGNDGFFTTYFVSPYSKYLARFAARRGWTPNAVSTVSLAVGLAAAASFALGSRAGLIAGAVLIQISFTIDCVDGQLARYTRTFSKLGAWLDSVFDRTKEYVVYAGLAVGATRGFDDDVWLLAAAALALQTVRHMADFSYFTTRRQAVTSTAGVPLGQAEDLPVAQADDQKPLPAEPTPRQQLLRRLIAVVAAVRRSSFLQWGNRIVRLPIGERFALISLTAAIASPRATFVALLAWGGIAAVYAFGVRLLISFSVPRRLVRALLA